MVGLEAPSASRLADKVGAARSADSLARVTVAIPIGRAGSAPLTGGRRHKLTRAAGSLDDLVGLIAQPRSLLRRFKVGLQQLGAPLGCCRLGDAKALRHCARRHQRQFSKLSRKRLHRRGCAHRGDRISVLSRGWGRVRGTSPWPHPPKTLTIGYHGAPLWKEKKTRQNATPRRYYRCLMPVAPNDCEAGD